MGNTGLSRRNSVFFSNKQDSSASDKSDKQMISSRQSTLHEDEELLMAAKNAPPPEPLTERQKQLLCETWTILEKDIASVGVITFISGDGWKIVATTLVSFLILFYTLNLIYSVMIHFMLADQNYMSWNYLPIFLRAGWCESFCSTAVAGSTRNFLSWTLGHVFFILLHILFLGVIFKEIWSVLHIYILFGMIISVFLALVISLSAIMLLKPPPIKIPGVKSELCEWALLLVFSGILTVYLMMFLVLYKFKTARIEEGFYAQHDGLGIGCLFETHPDVQQVFMPFRGIELEELTQSKQLRAHALRVMAFVQKAIARLQDADKLDGLIRDLGKKHYGYGAKRSYVDLIGPQFVQAIQPSLEKQWNSEVEEAWNALFKQISYIMKEAITSEEQHQKK